MVRPREFDEQEALDTAMQLFWEKGYEATSLTDLTSRMGIGRPSLYAAFGDKKELFAAALHKYSGTTLDNIRAKFEAIPSVKEAFRTFLDEMMERAYGDGPNCGRFCVNTIVELAPHDAQFEMVTKDFEMKLADLFQQKIEQGIRSGELATELDAVGIARTLTVSTVGLIVMLKARPERAFVESVATVLLRLLK
ncbi:TetR/AcrR family transcriptional regulator [Paenibacillus sp. P26]|nr:TetR/AcrR family transcriptional regulator [Paenibacillus sp. P26]